MKAEFNALNISSEEIQAIEAYKGNGHLAINSLLEKGLNNEFSVINKHGYLALDEESVARNINTIKKLYSAMLKYSLQSGSPGSLYRGTSDEELRTLSEGKIIGRCISTTTDKSMAEGYFTNIHQNKAVVYVRANGDVPYLNLKNVLENYGNNWEREVLLSPFTKVTRVKEVSNYNGKNYYGLDVEKTELPEIADEQLQQLETEFMSGCSKANDDLMQNLAIQKEIQDMHIKIQYYQKLFDQTTDKEDRKDIRERINSLYNGLDIKNQDSKLLEQSYSSWKEKVIEYTMGSCNQIEKSIKKDFENEKTQVENKKTQQMLQELQSQKSVVMDSTQQNIKHCSNIQNSIQSLNDVKNQYVKCAENLEIEYASEIDIPRMQGSLMRVQGDITNVYNKANNTEIKPDALELSSSIHSEFASLSQLNTRLDECLGGLKKSDLTAIERNELVLLKKGISLKIDTIKASAEMKKLSVQKETLAQKPDLAKKLFDRITGQDKVHSAEIEQINIKQTAIQNKLASARKESRQDYSVHEMLSDVDVYIDRNKDIEIVEDDLQQLQTFRSQITEYFGVDEQKIQRISTEKPALTESENTPSKTSFFNKIFGNKQKQMQEIRSNTKQWISENGYECPSNALTFPKENKVTNILSRAENIISNQAPNKAREKVAALEQDI